MGRTPCCAKVGLNRGAWTALEDKILADYIQVHGEGRWKQLPKNAGLKRCGKSCRLRWLNYLRPDIKRGNISEDEEELIVRLHKLLGNRWSLIAGRIPGRTDNEIKNYWNTKLSKKVASPSSLSPVTTTTNPNKSSQITKQKYATNIKNAMTVTTGTKSSTRVFLTRATRCSKVVIQPQPPPPPPASTSTYINPSTDHGEIFAVDYLLNDLPMIPDFNNLLVDDHDIDDLSLGDFCLADFLNNYEFDESQSTINNTEIEKDHDFSETVHQAYDEHDYRGQILRQSSTNVGSDMNSCMQCYFI